MPKVGGTYPSIIGGVSQRTPHLRAPGQQTEQVNMLSDVRRGLIRRRGSTFAAKIALTTSEGMPEDLQRMDVFDFTIEGDDYALVYRKYASSHDKNSFLFLFDKNAKTFIPIVYENSTWVNTLVAGGASSLACIGQYVYIAGNTTIPAVTTTNVWEDPINEHKLAAWIRAGAYSRTFTVTLVKEDGTTTNVSYTTKSASYPNTLDTSDIDFFESDGTTPRPDYQKDVNDRVNAFNGNATQWISEAAADIQPENIANELADALVLAGVTDVFTDVGGVLVNDPVYVDVIVSDGGDNTLMYGVGKEITAPERVTKYHWHGKVVRVRPSGAGSDEAFYLEARLDNGETSGFGSVSWFETAGIISQIDTMVAQLVIGEGTAYVARDGAGLDSLYPAGAPHPEYKASTVGDPTTAPTPNFIGKVITCLSVFQDRLLAWSGGTANASRVGDYLNFFRSSVLTVLDTDPIEVYAYGSEGDSVRSSVLYNKNLIAFGEKNQYGIDGSSLFTPKSPLVGVVSSNDDSTDAKPVASGNYIFYGQYGEDQTSLHQMRVGSINGQATISDELSEDLDSWLVGKPLQITAMTSPSVIFYRTENRPSDVFLYQYADNKNNGQRVVEAFNRLTYATSLGVIIGVSVHAKELILFCLRAGCVTADVLSLSTELDDAGYFDSRYPAASVVTNGVPMVDSKAVVNSDSVYFMLGCPAEDVEDLIDQLTDLSLDDIDFGVVSEARCVPTNPYQRNSNGLAVLDGRLTVNRLALNLADTGGLIADVETSGGVVETKDFEGRIVGNSDNLLARQPLYTGDMSISIGKETRAYELALRSKDWLPLNITAIAWTGQLFNNVRRIG